MKLSSRAPHLPWLPPKPHAGTLTATACCPTFEPLISALLLLRRRPLISHRLLSSLLRFLISAGRLAAARSLLSSPNPALPVKMHHLSLLARAFFRVDSIEPLLDLLDLMASRGLVPIVFFYGTLISDLTRSPSSVAAASALLDQMQRSGWKPDAAVWNCFVYRFVKEGDFGRAEELMVEMEREGVAPDVVTYNVLIKGSCEHLGVVDGFWVFRGMVGRDLVPDVVSFSTLIWGLRKGGRVEECEGLVGRMVRSGVLMDEVCHMILFRVYCGNGRVGDGVRVATVMAADGFLEGLGCKGGFGFWGGWGCRGAGGERVLGVVVKKGLMGAVVRCS